MIIKQDILDRATEWKLRPDVVEKDYCLGWLLAGVSSLPEMRSTWIFKGGTCIKKCFFETYRFSEDLDFSLLPEASYNETSIKALLQRLTEVTSELSGIRFPADFIAVKPRIDKLGRQTFEGKIAYQGPLNIPTLPRILFDITQHEPILDQPSEKLPFHPYPDQLPQDHTVLTYSLEELIAEKTRALYERTRPRDLYDVVFLLANHADQLNFSYISELFQKKCEAKGKQIPTRSQLLEIVRASGELRSEWSNMLAHQLPVLPNLDNLLPRLDSLIVWIDQPEALPAAATLSAPPISATEELIAPSGIQYWNAHIPLEAIRFAGANRLIVEFDYDGKHRLVESYSLRRASTGNTLLYAHEQGSSTQIKAFNIQKIQNVQVTSMEFSPRYHIELTTGGPLHIQAASRSSSSSYDWTTPTRRTRSFSGGPTYIYECTYCGKEFKHSTRDSSLRKHKDKHGYDCSGRRGYLVRVD